MPFFSSKLHQSVLPFKRGIASGLICIAMFCGCADTVGAPVNLNLAQETLETVMEGWKDGIKANDLLGQSPSIVVQEPDWNDETKLLDYQILNNDSPAGPNLVATVKLKLGKADGTVSERTATYVVGTSPSLTVYRNLMK